jgi:triphosphatase
MNWMPTEFELKLLAPPQSLDRLRKAPIIAQNAKGPGTTRRLKSVYYDTRDHALLRSGISLRVRKIGPNFVQTIKTKCEDSTSFERSESEARVPSSLPDASSIKDRQFRKVVKEHARELEPIFTTKVTRHAINLELDSAIVEVAFDKGTIETTDKVEAVSEIELELKSGNSSRIYDFGKHLIDSVPLKVGTLSKSDRGYALAFDLAKKSTKVNKPIVTSEMEMTEAITAILMSCQAHILANQAVAEEGRDIEGVHQMRIGLRRLRSALFYLRAEVPSNLFRPLDNEADWILSILNPARSWDVFVTATLGRLSDHMDARISFDELRQEAENLRQRSYQALRETLASPRYSHFHLSLGRTIEGQSWAQGASKKTARRLSKAVSEAAPRIFKRLLKKAKKRGAKLQLLDAEKRHKLRISLKRLRYAIDTLDSAGKRKATRRYLNELSHLQEVFGADSDVQTTRLLLGEIGQATESLPVQTAIGAVIGWQGRERNMRAKKIERAWFAFKKLDPPWE